MSDAGVGVWGLQFSMTDVGLRQGSDASLLKVGESLLHVHSARTQLVAGLKYEIVFETELGCFQVCVVYVCVCMSVCIHTYMYVCVCEYVYVYIRVCMRVFMYDVCML